MVSIRSHLVIAISLLLWVGCFAAPASHAQQDDALEEDFKARPSAGQRTFAARCAGCHGLDGRGSDKAPNIAGNAKMQHLSDDQISSIISTGVPGTGMPAFRSLSPAQVHSLVGYLRVLQGRLAARALPGDAGRGKKIFFSKGECSNCHTISGEGGFLGPDLSAYGSAMSADAILKAIVNPVRISSAGYKSAVVTTRDGARMEGVIRNEDNFSVQLQTADGSFHFFQKYDVQSLEYLGRSLMPTNYGERLSRGELDDLTSYLMSAGSSSKAEPGSKNIEDDGMRSAGNAVLGFVTVACLFLTAGAQEPRAFGLRPISPSFWDLVDHNAKLEAVATGFGFTEGPMWDPAGFLYVSDETINKIFRVDSNGKKQEVIALGDPDGNTFDRQHRLIDCASVLRAIIEVTPDGKYKILADRYEGKKFNSPNDVIVGPDGALYFTDPTLDLVAGEKQEIPFQGVYRLDDKGNVRLLTKDLAQPNGLAFSPDGKQFYVDDSERRNIRVYDVSPDGALTHGRIFGEEPGAKDDGVPDGIKVDKSGNLFVTGPKGIWVWDAKGNHLGTIVMPEQPANLTWGDADYKTLYITATTSVYRLRMKTQGFVPYLEH